MMKFMTAISLAPGAAIAARTIGAVSQKLLQTFMKAGRTVAILQFSGDFNIANGLPEGYYIILGTRDPNNPSPTRCPSSTSVSLPAGRRQQVTHYLTSFLIFSMWLHERVL